MRDAMWYVFFALGAMGCPGIPPNAPVRDGAADAQGMDAVTPDVLSDVTTPQDRQDVPPVPDADVPPVPDADVPPVPDAGAPAMRITFTSWSASGRNGAASMRAHMVWHGALRGERGGVRFEGVMR